MAEQIDAEEVGGQEAGASEGSPPAAVPTVDNGEWEDMLGSGGVLKRVDKRGDPKQRPEFNQLVTVMC